MTLEKAIEHLTQIERFSNYPFMPGDKQALRLSIRALERELDARQVCPVLVHYPLLGEEKE